MRYEPIEAHLLMTPAANGAGRERRVAREPRHVGARFDAHVPLLARALRAPKIAATREPRLLREFLDRSIAFLVWNEQRAQLGEGEPFALAVLIDDLEARAAKPMGAEADNLAEDATPWREALPDWTASDRLCKMRRGPFIRPRSG